MFGDSTVGGAPTLFTAFESANRKKKPKKQKNAKAKKEKKEKGKGKKGGDKPGSTLKSLTVQALNWLDLASPKGRYQLDLAHPACVQVLKEFVNKRQEIQCAGTKESLTFLNVSLNGKTIGSIDNQLTDFLPDKSPADLNILTFEIDAPAVDLNSVEKPIPSPVFDWILRELSSKQATEAWKRQLVESISKMHILDPQKAILVVDLCRLSHGLLLADFVSVLIFLHPSKEME